MEREKFLPIISPTQENDATGVKKKEKKIGTLERFKTKPERFTGKYNKPLLLI